MQPQRQCKEKGRESAYTAWSSDKRTTTSQGRAVGGWGWGNTSPHGMWRRALTQALPALLLPTRSDYTTRYGRPYGQHRMQCMAQRQQPCDHIGCVVSACPCNDSTRHNRPAMIQRRYRMPSVQHIPTLEGSRVSITMLYSDGAEGARLRIVIVSVDNAVEVADVLPLELAELGWFRWK